MKEDILLLSLDLATATGVARGRISGLPSVDTVVFGDGKSHASAFAHAFSWFESEVREFQPDVVVVESPLPPIWLRGFTHMKTTRKLFGLSASISCAAWRLGITELYEVPIADVRYWAFGKRNLKSEVAKRMAVEFCDARGIATRNHNESDAALLWLYAAANIVGEGGALKNA